MTLSIYMDENVHGAITNGLRLRGIDVLTVQEDGRSSIPDPAVLDRSIELNRILFSQDDDLLKEANVRQRIGSSFLGVVFAQQNAVSIGTCIEDLELIVTLVSSEELRNRVTYLPLTH